MRIEFLIFLLFSFYWLNKYKHKISLHLIVNIIMYGFYAFLWWMMYQPYSNPHHGDKGLGFAFFTIFTIPFYLLINIFNVVRNRKRIDLKEKKVFNINLVGLILGLTHLGVFLFLIL
ncbi:hypothetical protein [Flavobacterium sp.]|uniref:hypothetical protein n=1 Tax=Flavobacterium sp. TaxID=239 RepID=UPI00286E06A5|nr:hypothetical protein [Flavobacterium sp.]